MALFIPSFEGNWTYQSFLVLPTPAELAATPGSPVTSKKWAMGKLLLAKAGDNMEATGQLTFLPGVELKIHVTFVPGKDGSPAKFEATGRGESGPTAGAVYELVGWAIPDAAGQLLEVRGSVRAVRGPDSNPAVELGRMPVNTVGAFVISK